MRWDLIDRFHFLKKNRSAKASKSFSAGEDFFKDHFPGKAVFPEVLYIEMIAQTGGVLYGLDLDFKKEVILAKIARAVFHEAVKPPCAFEIEAQFEDEREEGAWMTGKVMCNGKTVAEAEIMLVTMESGVLGFDKKIVFNDGFLKHYDILNVAKQSEKMEISK